MCGSWGTEPPRSDRIKRNVSPASRQLSTLESGASRITHQASPSTHVQSRHPPDGTPPRCVPNYKQAPTPSDVPWRPARSAVTHRALRSPAEWRPRSTHVQSRHPPDGTPPRCMPNYKQAPTPPNRIITSHPQQLLLPILVHTFVDTRPIPRRHPIPTQVVHRIVTHVIGRRSITALAADQPIPEKIPSPTAPPIVSPRDLTLNELIHRLAQEPG